MRRTQRIPERKHLLCCECGEDSLDASEKTNCNTALPMGWVEVSSKTGRYAYCKACHGSKAIRTRTVEERVSFRLLDELIRSDYPISDMVRMHDDLKETFASRVLASDPGEEGVDA